MFRARMLSRSNRLAYKVYTLTEPQVVGMRPHRAQLHTSAARSWPTYHHCVPFQALQCTPRDMLVTTAIVPLHFGIQPNPCTPSHRAFVYIARVGR